MQVKTVPAPTLSAVSTLLPPYIPGLTPSVLIQAIKAHESGDTTTPGHMVNVRTAARILDVSLWTVVRMIKDGKLPGRKIGAQWRVPESALRDLSAPTLEG